MQTTPHGVECWHDTERDCYVVRIHYSADPAKDAAWVRERKKRYPSERVWQQEMEIDAYAHEGALMYPEFNPALTVCEPFPIPHDWTRYMAIDPHKRRPHAFLWMAVDPYGDHWYYREYWPSKVCGRKGNVPEDDRLYHIDDYAKTVLFLESAEITFFAPNGFADNSGRAEQIRQRIMDTHGKAIFAETRDGRDDSETFWDRYRACGIRCVEARKDVKAGRDIVARGLRPRRVMGPNGEREESRIHIFSTLPELIHELKTVRWATLTPAQAARRDPSDQELEKRKHMIDLLRYLEISEPRYIAPHVHAPQVPAQVWKGVNY